MRKISEFVIAAFLMLAAWPAAADQIVTLNYTRDAGGATVNQSYLLISDLDPAYTLPDAKATLLLFVGGAGKLGVADGQLGVSSTNFLTRTRHLFAASGPFNVALMDAASDFLSMPAGLRYQRLTPEYLEDMQRVIADLRERFNDLPVYVVGTSRGTIAAAFAAASLPPAAGGPDGMVLTSAVTQPGSGNLITLEAPFTVDLAAIGVPSLVVAHEADGCSVTPPEDAEPLAKLLEEGSAPSVELELLSGGLPAISTACQALSEHGFFGIEHEAVNEIAKWIREQLE